MTGRWRATRASGRVWAGAAIVLLVLASAAFAPWLAPRNPEDQDLLNTLLPPVWAGGDWAFPLGTDALGRDILSRLIWGARVAMYVAVLAAACTMLLGSLLALAAGYFGGWVDWLISRAVEVWMSFPPVILSVILMVGLGVGINKVVLAIVLVDWTRFCRVVRSDVAVVARRDYVAAARLIGYTHLQVLRREILPAVLPLIVTLLTLEMGIAVVVEAILSFVGLSVEADMPAWGVMIADGRQDMYEATWSLVLPVLAILLTVIGFNLLGDGLRRSLDPRLHGGRL